MKKKKKVFLYFVQNTCYNILIIFFILYLLFGKCYLRLMSSYSQIPRVREIQYFDEILL